MKHDSLLSQRIILLKNELKNNIPNTHVVDNFWNEIKEKGSPIIEEISPDSETILVTFLYKGNDDTRNIIILSPFLGNEYKTSQLEHISNTNIWYKTYELRKDLRIVYNLSVNDLLDDDMTTRDNNLTYDSLNPNKFIFPQNDEDPESKELISSLLELPYTDKFIWSVENDYSAKGTLEVHRFHSKLLNNDRRIWVYTPNGYSRDKLPYGVVVTTDGFKYINLLSAPTVLDNLVSEGKVPPMVGIFIETSKNRTKELNCNKTFSDFVANEVMPWTMEHYNITKEPTKNVIAGLSFGGLTASFLGLNHSHIFGNVLSQSGSYWWSPATDGNFNWMSRQYEAKEKLPLKFYLNIGVLEPADAMIETNENFRDTLISKGYNLTYETFNSGHDYLYWGETLANGLMSLVGIH